MDQDGTWHGSGPRLRPHCAGWRPNSPPQKRMQSPPFSAHFYCGQTAGCIKMPLGMEVGLGQGHIVLDGDPAPPKGSTSRFSVHVYCGQTAGWIKMPLGTDVGLGPGDVVLNGVAVPHKGDTAPVFGPCLLWPNDWMDEDATWYGCRLRPRQHCVRWGPISPKRAQPPNFWPMSDGLRCHLVCRYAPALATLCSMETQPPEKNGRALPTQFLAHVYCGQRA